MSPAELARHWFEEVWNKKNRQAIGEMLTAESVHYGLADPASTPVAGIEAFEEFFDSFAAVFPDLHIEIQDTLTEGDKVAIRYIVTGTHLGDLPGLPATGRTTRFTGGGMCRVKNGKFAEVWNQVDFAKMNHDLAADPSAANISPVASVAPVVEVPPVAQWDEDNSQR